MTIFDRQNGVGNSDRPSYVPLEPTDLFTEVDTLDATLHSGRVMYRAGTGLLRSDGTSWVGMPRKLWCPAIMGVIGGTAGFVIAADDGLARVPASQTSSTFVVPLVGLNLGDRITALRVIGQVDSVGGAVVVLLDAAKSTAAAGDFSQAAMGSQQTTGSLVADTLISAAVLEITGLTEVVATLETFFALITVTTAASTDVAIGGVEVDIA